MKTIKIIELLVKVANGEEVPRKIKWGEFELEWEELGYHDYKFLDTGNHLLFQGFATSVLNDEVEIIEDKKIKELKKSNIIKGCINNEIYYEEDYNVCEFGDKINEIIKVINEKL